MFKFCDFFNSVTGLLARRRSNKEKQEYFITSAWRRLTMNFIIPLQIHREGWRTGWALSTNHWTLNSETYFLIESTGGKIKFPDLHLWPCCSCRPAGRHFRQSGSSLRPESCETMKTPPPSPAVRLARVLGYRDIPGPRSLPLVGNILGYRAPGVGRSGPQRTTRVLWTHILPKNWTLILTIWSS